MPDVVIKLFDGKHSQLQNCESFPPQMFCRVQYMIVFYYCYYEYYLDVHFLYGK